MSRPRSSTGRRRSVLAPGFFLFCALFVFAPELSAQPVAPGFRFWRSIHTPHFTFHYPRQHEKTARRMGVIAEKVHAKLNPKYRTGAEHTHVVLVFDSDLVNAFALPAYGFDWIVLYMDSPRLGSFSRFDMWAELVFTHEYTHILSLRYTGSFWTMFFRLVSGVPPNLLSPPGFVEGVGVYEESKAGRGRLNDALTNMQHRTAMLDGTYPNQGETLAGSHRWPFGSHIYLYGGRFYDFLARKFGDRVWTSVWRMDNYWGFCFDEILPFCVGDTKLEKIRKQIIRRWKKQGTESERAAAYRRHTLRSLYAEFVQEERARAERVAAEIERLGATPFQRLTFDGYSKSFLTASTAGQLYYFATPRDRRPGVFQFKPGRPGDGDEPGPEPERLRRSSASAGFAIAGGREIYSEPNYIYPGIYGFRYEIYQEGFFDKRLNPDRSSSFPALSANGRRLYFVERDPQERRLIMAETDRSGRIARRRVLLKTNLTGLIQYTALSPDDRYLAVVVRRGERGSGSILLCDVGGPLDAQVNCPPLVGGDNVKMQPRFSEDGSRLLFSSDADGIYNIYAVEIATGEVRRLTRTVTGIFAPAPLGPDLYALGFFREGYDVIRIRNQDLLSEKVDYFAGPDGDAQIAYDEAEAAGFRETGYWGPLELRPFLVGIGGTGLAVIPGATFGVGARDPLNRHFFVAAYDFAAGVGFAQYDYSRFALGLSLSYFTNWFDRGADRGCVIDGDLYRPLCADPRVAIESGTALFRYAHAGKHVVWQALLGGIHMKIRNAQNLVNDGFEERDLNLSGPAGVFLIGDTAYYPESISSEHGWVFLLSSQYYHEDYSYKQVDRINTEPVSYGVAEGGFALYLPSFWSHHVNYLSGYGYGTYGPDREMQTTRLSRWVRGQNFGKAPTDHAAAVFTYEYRFPLAYISNAIIPDEHSLMLRKVGASVFVDYGTVFDRYPYREDWVGAYGAALTFGVNFAYLGLAEMKVSVARGTGPAGELQAWFSLNASFGGASFRDDEGPAYRKPYRPGLPVSRWQPGYWRDKNAGGVLE